MKKTNPENVFFHTNDIRHPLVLSCVLGGDLSCKWLMRFRPQPTGGYSVSITNDVLRFPGIRKQVLKEKERILRYVHVVKEYIQSHHRQDGAGDPDVPVIQGAVCNGVVETWVDCFAGWTKRHERSDITLSAKPASVSEKCPGSLNYPKLVDTSKIEPQIRELVMAVNDAGSLRTMFNCQGHLIRPPRSPFVNFLAEDMRDVFKLRDIVDACSLNYGWFVEGTPLCKSVQWQLATTGKRTSWSKAGLREDISNLSRAIRATFLKGMAVR